MSESPWRDEARFTLYVFRSLDRRAARHIVQKWSDETCKQYVLGEHYQFERQCKLDAITDNLKSVEKWNWWINEGKEKGGRR